MSYPNWKEPSTAVKTVKTKVPVILNWLFAFHLFFFCYEVKEITFIVNLLCVLVLGLDRKVLFLRGEISEDC